MHNHVMPWTDRPLVTQDLVGGEEGISDAGLSLSPPHSSIRSSSWRRRRRSIAASRRSCSARPSGTTSPTSDACAGTGTSRSRRTSTSAASFAHGTANDGEGRASRRWHRGADVTLRYRPLRRAIYRRLLARTELVWSRRELGRPSTAHAFGALRLAASTSSPAAGSPGVRYDHSDRADRPVARGQGRSRRPHRTGRASSARSAASTATRRTAKASRPTSSSSSSSSRSAPTAPTRSD